MTAGLFCLHRFSTMKVGKVLLVAYVHCFTSAKCEIAS